MPYIALLKVFKSKWTWIAIVTMSLLAFIWHYGGLKEDLANAYARVSSLVQALETSNESIARMERELARIDGYILERESERKDIQKEFENIRNEFERERQRNEAFNMCWDVPFSPDFLNRM